MKQFKVNDQDIDSLIEFAASNPTKPQHPPYLIRRFLMEYSSSRDLIIDLHDDRGRVACAVILDRVQNAANDVNLEIVGYRADANTDKVMERLVTFAGANVPKDRAGFQVVVPEERQFSREFLESTGLAYYYDAYEMTAASKETEYSSSEIRTAIARDRDEVFDVLCRAFAESFDASLPEAGSWNANFLKNPSLHLYVWEAENRILGFAQLFLDESDSAEIRLVGVLPEARGKQIGEKLLRHCFGQAKELGKAKCHLTVAVQNKRALDLYLRTGFKPVEIYTCYRKPVG